LFVTEFFRSDGRIPLYNPQGRQRKLSWPELRAKLETPFRGASFDDLQEAEGWSPVAFHGDYRKLENVNLVYALGLDYDSLVGNVKTPIPSIDVVLDCWRGYHCLVHTTRHHAPGACRCRVIVETDRPFSAKEHGKLFRWAKERSAEHGLQIDTQAADPSRFWYVPSALDGAEFICVEIE
jgi:hypothetical protein